MKKETVDSKIPKSIEENIHVIPENILFQNRIKNHDRYINSGNNKIKFSNFHIINDDNESNKANYENNNFYSVTDYFYDNTFIFSSEQLNSVVTKFEDNKLKLYRGNSVIIPEVEEFCTVLNDIIKDKEKSSTNENKSENLINHSQSDKDSMEKNHFNIDEEGNKRTINEKTVKISRKISTYGCVAKVGLEKICSFLNHHEKLEVFSLNKKHKEIIQDILSKNNNLWLRKNPFYYFDSKFGVNKIIGPLVELFDCLYFPTDNAIINLFFYHRPIIKDEKGNDKKKTAYISKYEKNNKFNYSYKIILINNSESAGYYGNYKSLYYFTNKQSNGLLEKVYEFKEEIKFCFSYTFRVILVITKSGVLKCLDMRGIENSENDIINGEKFQDCEVIEYFTKYKSFIYSKGGDNLIMFNLETRNEIEILSQQKLKNKKIRKIIKLNCEGFLVVADYNIMWFKFWYDTIIFKMENIIPELENFEEDNIRPFGNDYILIFRKNLIYLIKLHTLELEKIYSENNIILDLHSMDNECFITSVEGCLNRWSYIGKIDSFFGN